MKNRFFEIFKEVALITLIAIAALIISWVVAVFVYWLLSWCFDWTFSLRYATGFWLICGLIASVVSAFDKTS